MKECLLYKLEGDIIECQTCSHYCRIQPYKTGICGVRENQKGKLYNLTYGRIIAEHIDPIEKKPLFHFLKNTYTLSIASAGCNFKCSWCQNWDISQCVRETYTRNEISNTIGAEMEPEQIISDAQKNKCPSISYTYTEPTIFLEFAYDTMRLAKENNLKNIWVSNGYMSKETIQLISPYLDAINIDLKGFSEENYLKFSGARLQPVLDNIKQFQKNKIHIEITTLLIPGVNDSDAELKEIANFIFNTSPFIPWHISRFFPAYKMTDVPTTPVESLQRARNIGKKVGLNYIYLGNI